MGDACAATALGCAPTPDKFAAWCSGWETWPDAGVELGVTAIEYALIAGLIALAIIAGAGLLGDEVGAAFDFVAAQVGAEM